MSLMSKWRDFFAEIFALEHENGSHSRYWSIRDIRVSVLKRIVQDVNDFAKTLLRAAGPLDKIP